MSADVRTAGWVVHCDFDGTVSTTDVTDSLLERFGGEGWRALEAAWERGEIGSQVCMQGQVALLEMDEAAFVAHLGSLALDPQFGDFVRAAGERDMPVTISSDGLDRAIRTMLARAGWPELPVLANRLEMSGPRRWRLTTPLADPACARASGHCKCASLARDRSGGRRVLYIGDGASDFCVAPRADFVLAKDRLLAFCRQQGLPHRAITGFADALAWLQTTHPLPETLR